MHPSMSIVFFGFPLYTSFYLNVNAMMLRAKPDIRENDKGAARVHLLGRKF